MKHCVSPGLLSPYTVVGQETFDRRVFSAPNSQFPVFCPPVENADKQVILLFDTRLKKVDTRMRWVCFFWRGTVASPFGVAAWSSNEEGRRLFNGQTRDSPAKLKKTFITYLGLTDRLKLVISYFFGIFW